MAVEVNISSKSGLVSGGNWAPALAAAYADIAPTGGAIFLDAVTEFQTMTSFEGATGNYTAVSIIGKGAPCRINGNNTVHIFQFGNRNQVKFIDIPFIGEQGTSQTPDCNYVIFANYTENVAVENCTFGGILAAGSLIGTTAAAELHVIGSKFGGCGGDHIKGNAVNGLTVKRSQFYDYQSVAGEGYDRQAPRRWIVALGGTTPIDAKLGYVKIENVRLDEGAANAVTIEGYPYVAIKQTAHNLNTEVGRSLRLTNVDHALIEQFWCGYQEPGKAMEIVNCGEVIIEGFRRHNGNKEIVIDAATRFVQIKNSPDAIVEAEAGASYELNGIRYRGGAVQI